MQSLDKKYEGQELAMLNTINEKFEGRPYSNATMEFFGAKDYIAWKKWVDKNQKRFTFKFLETDRSPIAEHFMAPDVRLLQKYTRKVSLLKLQARLRAENERLDKEIAMLERKILLGEMAWNVEGDYDPSELKL